MSKITEQVGQLIREARKSKGMTQKELANQLEISAQAMNRYENGQNLTVETLYKIAQALSLTISDLVKGL